MSTKQLRVWYGVLIGELLFTSFLFLGLSFFAEYLGIDSGGSWGVGRKLFSVPGFILAIVSALLVFPRIKIKIQTYRVASFTRYVTESTAWILIALMLCEIILRATVSYNPKTDYEKDWGIVPVMGSNRFWGKEGYGITHYLTHGEIASPLYNGAQSVVVLGDSNTEALQVSDEVKFVSLAEMNIRSKGKAINLHNLGTMSNSIPDYIYLAPLIKQYYKPEIIVIQLSPQDFYGADGGDGFRLKHRNYFIINDDGNLEIRHKNQHALGFYNKVTSRIMLYSLGLERFVQIEDNTVKLQVAEQKLLQTGGSTISPASRMDDQLGLLKEAYSGMKVILLLLPYSPNIAKGDINFDDPEYLKLLESAERVGNFYIVNPRSEFILLVDQNYLPRGFMNSLPGVGHMNIFGHRVIGELLAKKILEITQ